MYVSKYNFGIISLTNKLQGKCKIYILKYKTCQPIAMYGPYLDTDFFLNLKKIMTIIGNLKWILYDKEFLLFTDKLM